MTIEQRMKSYSRQRRGYFLPAGTLTPAQRRRLKKNANRFPVDMTGVSQAMLEEIYAR